MNIRRVLGSIGMVIGMLIPAVLSTAAGLAASQVREIDKKMVERSPELEGLAQNTKESGPAVVTYAVNQSNIVTQLDADQVGQPTDRSNVAFNEKRNGIYFIKASDALYAHCTYEVVFYDLKNQTYETVYKSAVRKVENYYVDDQAAYFVTSTTKTLSTPVTENGETYEYDNYVSIDKVDFDTGEVSKQTFHSIYGGYMDFAVGVDAQGRYYIAGVFAADSKKGRLYLFDSNGNRLDQCALTGRCDGFYGFDPHSGNFYYSGSYNWRYWGYDHDMTCLMAGNVTNNKLSVTEKNISQLYQSSFYTHVQPVQMLSDRYLGIYSGFNGCVMLLDSNQYDYTDYTEQSTSIDLISGSTSTTSINIKNTTAVKLALATGDTVYHKDEYGIEDYELSTVGTRCGLCDDGKTLVSRTSEKQLDLYDIASKTKKLEAKTAYPIHTFAIMGDQCVVVERDGEKVYVETIDWTYPTDFTVQAPETMTVGDYQQMICTADTAFTMDYTYVSADSSIVSVDADGNLNAWKEGSTEITITCPLIGRSHTITVTVTGSDISDQGAAYTLKESTGMNSYTMHAGVYRNFGSTRKAHLSQLADGNYERVEYIDQKLIREVYNSNYELQSQNEIAMELPIFGGYYEGNDSKYIVVGQNNKEEKDNTEVIRVIRYDKNWNRVGACSIYGSNTYEPFNAGSLNMVETGGKLYIHTCHTMYKESSDGLHHQANCTFVVKESDMTLADSYYDTMNMSTGYVSHSFMQWINTDGENIYRVDLGDAYPRGIAYSRTSVDAKVGEPNAYGKLLTIDGTIGNNYTGYTLGGLQLSDAYWITVGSGIKSMRDTGSNIFVITGHKDQTDCTTTWITQNPADGNVKAYAPKLVRLKSNQFLLMWEECTNEGTEEKIITKMALLNPDGALASEVYASPLALADCEPIVNTDGMVMWYVTNKTAPVFVMIDPYRLSAVQEESKYVTSFAVDNGNGYYNDWSDADDDDFWDRYFEDLYNHNKSDKTDPEKMNSEESQDEEKVERKKNSSSSTTVVRAGNLRYQTIAKNKVSVVGVTSKKVKKLTIPATITIQGKKYTVTAIGSKAFSGCKNLKQVTIKSKKITKIGKNAFQNGNKKAVVKVPKSKKKVYKKLLKKAGYKGKVK